MDCQLNRETDKECNLQIFRNGEKRIACSINLNDCGSISRLKELIADEMGINYPENIRVYTETGVEIVHEDDFAFLKKNSTIFYTKHNEGFNYKNCLVPYDLLKPLGEGGFGRVILAKHRASGEKVAIKYLYCDSTNFDKRFSVLKEVKVLEMLRHPSIISLKNAFILETTLIIIMEYASGGELKEYLKKKGKLQEEEARDIIKQIADAIYFCHLQNVIHRDLKLENILFKDASCSTIKIVDFGIAGFNDYYVADKSRAGTIKYIPPEVLTGQNIDALPSIDIWSMGCILFSLVTGELPYEGKTFHEIAEKIKNEKLQFPTENKLSYHLRNLLSQMLEKDYMKRISLEGALQHRWMEGSSPGQSPDKKAVIAAEAICASAVEQKRVKQGEPLIRFRGSSRLPQGSRQLKTRPSYRLPVLDSHNRSMKKAIRPERSQNPITRENEEMSSLATADLHEAPKLLLLAEYQNIPSFMLPIHHSKAEKSVINIARGRKLSQKRREEPVDHHVTPLARLPRNKCRSASRKIYTSNVQKENNRARALP